ncbi:hypothetical protein AAE478_000479 [Parahypoxylon ruwenzoriense]
MPPNKRSPTPEHTALEDPETAAARKELRQTAISERKDIPEMSTETTNPAPLEVAAIGGDKASAKDTVSDHASLELRNDRLRDKVSSPKKKRAHDEVEEPKESSSDAGSDVSPTGVNAGASQDRTDRSEPEKKRPRDVSSEIKGLSDESIPSPTSTDEPKTGDKVKNLSTEQQGTEMNAAKSTKEDQVTSDLAFNSSRMSGFATQASPFLQAGAKPLASFASPSGSLSNFRSKTATPTASTFGSASLSNGTSSFGQVGGALKTFGGGNFGAGFGSGLGGSKLTSFGKPGETLKSSKPAKPFGAPASEGSDSAGEDDGVSEKEEKDNNEDNEVREEQAAAVDEKKKPKLQRIVVDDGEAGEATILQVRAKIYHLDKASSSWKERGAGNLKINVPQSCVDIDEGTGAPIPGSFDASALEDAESKVVRLVMRQDSTHRVILNTAVIPAMQFQEKSTVKATYVLFTAIEDEGAEALRYITVPDTANYRPKAKAVSAPNDKTEKLGTEHALGKVSGPDHEPSQSRDSGYCSLLAGPVDGEEAGNEDGNSCKPYPNGKRSTGSAKRKADEIDGPMTRARKRPRSSPVNEGGIDV